MPSFVWSPDKLQHLTPDGRRFCVHTSRIDEITKGMDAHNKKQVSIYLMRAMESTARRVSKDLKKYVSPEAFAALVSFALTFPYDKFCTSRLFLAIKTGKYIAGNEFLKYTTTASGEWRAEIEWQRNQEALLYEKGFYATEIYRDKKHGCAEIRIED